MAETLAAAHGRTAPRAPLTGGGGLSLSAPASYPPRPAPPGDGGGGGLTERLDRVASRLAGGGGGFL